MQVSPAIVESIRVSRRGAPDGRILFDTVAEVTQACVVERGGALMDVVGGCTIVIDHEGEVRFSIAKGVTARDRLDRQAKAIRGPLAPLWQRRREGSRHRFVARDGMLARIHAGRMPGARNPP